MKIRCSTVSSFIFSWVFGAIILLMGLATVLEVVYAFLLPQDATKPIYVKAVLCFSPYTNLKGIAKTTDSNAAGKIGCLDGMR